MGLDGMLDLSRTLTGYMLYERRTITMEFNILGPRAQWPDIHSDIMDMLHGAEMDVILDDDPEYCYTGTLEVDAFDPQQAVQLYRDHLIFRRFSVRSVGIPFLSQPRAA